MCAAPRRRPPCDETSRTGLADLYARTSLGRAVGWQKVDATASYGLRFPSRPFIDGERAPVATSLPRPSGCGLGDLVRLPAIGLPGNYPTSRSARPASRLARSRSAHDRRTGSAGLTCTRRHPVYGVGRGERAWNVVPFTGRRRYRCVCQGSLAPTGSPRRSILAYAAPRSRSPISAGIPTGGRCSSMPSSGEPDLSRIGPAGCEEILTPLRGFRLSALAQPPAVLEDPHVSLHATPRERHDHDGAGEARPVTKGRYHGNKITRPWGFYGRAEVAESGAPIVAGVTACGTAAPPAGRRSRGCR